MGNIETYYDLQRAGEILSYSPLTLRKFIKDGELDAVRWGREYRITESSLKKFIEDRQKLPIPEGSKPKERRSLSSDDLERIEE